MTGTGKNTKSKMFDIYILCEYKPKLEEVSAYLGQIHLYMRRLQDMYGDRLQQTHNHSQYL